MKRWSTSSKVGSALAAGHSLGANMTKIGVVWGFGVALLGVGGCTVTVTGDVDGGTSSGSGSNASSGSSTTSVTTTGSGTTSSTSTTSSASSVTTGTSGSGGAGGSSGSGGA